MTQFHSLYSIIVDEDGKDDRTSFLPRKSMASPKRSVRLLATAPPSSTRAKQPPRRMTVIKSPSESEVSEDWNAADYEEEATGSEDWNAGSQGQEDDVEEALAWQRQQGRKTMRVQTFLERLQEKRSTKSNFAFQVNLAFKGAVAVVLGNLPMLVHPVQLMIPTQFWPVLGYVGLYVAFTLWKTVGDTLMYAIQGISGALLGTLNVIAVTAAIGGSTPKSMLEGCFVWAEFVIFTILVLWLNLDGNTRQTALCTHVSYFMLVLKPQDPEFEKNLLKSFTLEEVFKWRAEVVNLSIVVAGNLLGLLAALMPLVPVLPSAGLKVGDALRYAEGETRDMAKQMGQLVLDAVKGFEAKNESLVVDGYIAQAMQMHVQLEKLETLTDAAWWEVMFPFMSYSRLRLRVIKDMGAIMSGVLDNVIILLYTLKYEDFKESHEEMMDEIEVPLDDLADFFNEELNWAMETLTQATLTQAHCQTTPSRSRKDVLTKKKDLIEELGKAYLRTFQDIACASHPSAEGQQEDTAPPAAAWSDDLRDRRSNTGSIRRPALSRRSTHLIQLEREQGKVAVICETMEESHFVYRMILMVDHLILRLERQEPDPRERQPVFSILLHLVRYLTNPDKLFHPEHVTFAIRQSITIVVCFVVAMCYYNYSATMVVTQSLLVEEANHTGSMLKKNIGRLQGVVIGTIFPHLFFDWFSECTVGQQVTLGVILFFFEWMALYVYFSSEDFGYVGCLVAAFGAGAMCQGCGRTPNTMKSLYLNMEQNAVGIAVLTIIDLVFAPERASDMANHLMCHDKVKKNGDVGMLPLLQYGLAMSLNLTFSPEDQEQGDLQLVMQHGFGDWNLRVTRQFRQALALCDEAYAEPRYMRRPWPHKFYQEVVKVCQGLRVDIIALTDTLRDTSKYEDHRRLLFDEVKEFKDFTCRIQRAFIKVSNMVRLAFKHFDEENGEQSRCITEIHEEARTLQIPTDTDVHKLSEALLNHRSFRQGALADSENHRRRSVRSQLLMHTFCKTSVVICVLMNVSRRLQKLHTTVVDSL